MPQRAPVHRRATLLLANGANRPARRATRSMQCLLPKGPGRPVARPLSQLPLTLQSTRLLPDRSLTQQIARDRLRPSCREPWPQTREVCDTHLPV